MDTQHKNGTILQRNINKSEFKDAGKEEKISGDDKTDLKTIGLVFLSLLLDLLAFTMILPLLPSLLDYYNREEGSGNGLYASLLGGVESFRLATGAPRQFASVLVGGALGSMFSFLQFLTSPVVGSLSDAYGRKPMLLICLAGIAISHALWGCAQSFWVFLLARAVGGLSKANVALSMAVVSDAASDKTRARGMALVGLAFSVGFTVGPACGAWAGGGAWGERAAGAALALTMLNLMLVALAMPETLHESRRTPLSLSFSRALQYISPWHLLRFSAVTGQSADHRRALSRLGLVYFLYLFLYSGLEFTITFLTHHQFHYTPMQQGKMFFVIGIIMAVLQGGAARRLSARGARVAGRASLALTPFAFVAVAFAASEHSPLLSPLVWLWIGLVIYAVSTAFAVSCMTAECASLSPEKARGAALGTLRSLGALARALGPLISAAAYWCAGPSATYTMGAALLTVPAAMLLALRTDRVLAKRSS